MSKSLPADTTKVWNERHGSLLSFNEELPVPRKESEVSRLSNQLKELEDKTQEIMYLQQELNELNASLKEEKWYSAALKEEVDKMTKEKVELEEKVSSLEMVSGNKSTCGFRPKTYPVFYTQLVHTYTSLIKDLVFIFVLGETNIGEGFRKEAYG